MRSSTVTQVVDDLPDSKNEILHPRVLKVLSVGKLAQIILDEEENPVNRASAKKVFYNKLREYNGARWVGASLEERADVIRVLRIHGN